MAIELAVQQGDIAESETDAIVVNLFEGVTSPAGATAVVDRALDGAIGALIAGGDFSGKAGTTALLYSHGKIAAARVLLVGLGPVDSFDIHGVRRSAAVAAKCLAANSGVQSFATIVHGAGIAGLEAQAAARAVVEGTLLAVHQVKTYRRAGEEISLDLVTVVEFDGDKLEAFSQGAAEGRIVAEAVGLARDLRSVPPNMLMPADLARRARLMAERVGLKVTVLGETAMRECGMRILLAVSQGSEAEAQFVILEHAPPGHETEAPLVLAGKGITFDTGGISIKGAAEMWRMKNDMGGAAAVIATMEAVARLALPRRVIGVTPCVENMPDGKAFRPGDVYTGVTGKTAEIISTDAEGRLVLADALGYVARFNPSAVIDLATLTGAVGIALGKNIRAGLCANAEPLQQALMAASARSGEGLWPFPMDDSYGAEIKSDVAEVKNSGGRFGGVSTSAKFLEHFTEDYGWAHLDIANMVWTDNDREPHIPKGATGFGVRLLLDYIANDRAPQD